MEPVLDGCSREGEELYYRIDSQGALFALCTYRIGDVHGGAFCHL